MKLVFIYGSTCVGKSDLALKISNIFGKAPIINADSSQVYKELDIGLDKVPEKKRAIYPHYLMDYVSYPKEYSVGEFYRDFKKTLKILKPHHSVALVVGGSAFYLKSLQTGLLPVVEIDLEIEEYYLKLLKTQGVKALWEELQSLCPSVAENIVPTDQYRVYRALTLYKSTGQSLEDLKKEYELKPLEHFILKVGLFMEREKLRVHVKNRIDKMFNLGLVEEVEKLIKRGFRNWKPLKSIGYREVLQMLEEGQSLEASKEKIFYRTMSLAKRQMTWFRKENDLIWFHHEKKDACKKFVKENINL